MERCDLGARCILRGVGLYKSITDAVLFLLEMVLSVPRTWVDGKRFLLYLVGPEVGFEFWYLGSLLQDPRGKDGDYGLQHVYYR